MKKVFTTLAIVILATLTSQAQRYTKVDAILISPTDNYNIPCDDSFAVEFVFINTGTETILATDTIFYITPYTIEGNVRYHLHGGNPIAPGDTIVHIRQFISVAGIGSESNKKLQRMADKNTGDWVFAPFVDDDYIIGIQVQGFHNHNNPDANTLLLDTAGGTFYKYVNATLDCETSIKSNELVKSHNLNVYPNPTASNINFKYNFTANTTASVKVTDVTGRTVLVQDFGKQTVGERNFSVNVSSLNTGMYYAELITDEVRAISKFNVAK